MLKNITLIAAMLPGTVGAHDFDQNYWLNRWLDNRINIGECLQLSEKDIPAFLRECDLDTMVTTENKENKIYNANKLAHPLHSDIEFIEEHFEGQDAEWIIGVYANVEATPVFAAVLIRMYIIKGLYGTDGTTEHTAEGNSSTIDKEPGNNTIHDK